MECNQVIQIINSLDVESLKKIRTAVNRRLEQTPTVNENNLMDVLWTHYQSDEFKTYTNYKPGYQTVGCYGLTREQFNNYFGPLSAEEIHLLSVTLRRNNRNDIVDTLNEICKRVVDNCYDDLLQIWKTTI
jgi:hypothetical protein